MSATLENPELKRIATAINDQSIEKEIAQKLSAAASGEDGSSCPSYLATALNNLKRRRDDQHRAMSKAHIARNRESPSELDRDTIEAMRRLTEIRRAEMGHPSTLK